MDYERTYERISRPFRNETAMRALGLLDKGLVYLIALAYIATLVWLFATGDTRAWKVLAVPAATFAITTLIRALVNAPRPYESARIDPLIQKDTQGKSFPSRHVASGVAIACAFLYLNPLAGSFALIACAAVCFTRIVGGVHFPRDVVAAVLIATACGIIGFALLP